MPPESPPRVAFFFQLDAHTLQPPSTSTATRLQCAGHLRIQQPGLHSPTTCRPHSCSFSSSFLMNGTTFPRMSSDIPQIPHRSPPASSTQTNSQSRTSLPAASSTSPIALQFGFVTIYPRRHLPPALRLEQHKVIGIHLRYHQRHIRRHRNALEFEITAHPPPQADQLSSNVSIQRREVIFSNSVAETLNSAATITVAAIRASSGVSSFHIQASACVFWRAAIARHQPQSQTTDDCSKVE